METIIIIVFLAGYLAITLEHNLKIDKLIPALAMMAILWALMAFGIDGFTTWFDSGNHALLENFGSFGHEEKMELMAETLLHHLGKTAEILVLLLGAMTIVEIIDAHEGFTIITEKISTTKRVKLIWILSIVTFFLSAALDNPNNRYRDVCSIKENDCRQKRFMAVCRYVDYCSQCRWSVVSNR
mgnify:CR=1 FL=1